MEYLTKITFATTIAALSLIFLTACDSPNDASEQNFSMALSQHLNKNGRLCLSIQEWPVDVTTMDIAIQKNSPSSLANQMMALESAGLVTRADIQGTGFNQGIIKRYSLSDAAKPYLHEESQLCWGQRSLDNIVKWEGPIKLGDYQEVSVTYLYKIDNLADWANKPEIQKAFPEVKNIIDGANVKESKHTLKLTSKGWEAKGLNLRWE